MYGHFSNPNGTVVYSAGNCRHFPWWLCLRFSWGNVKIISIIFFVTSQTFYLIYMRYAWYCIVPTKTFQAMAISLKNAMLHSLRPKLFYKRYFNHHLWFSFPDRSGRWGGGSKKGRLLFRLKVWIQSCKVSVVILLVYVCSLPVYCQTRKQRPGTCSWS